MRDETISPAEEEARKEQERAAKAEARDARTANLERRGEATREELIADLLRVAQIPRPLLGPSASRQRYRELGHFPETLVYDFFGNHQEFRRAAGLQDSRTESRLRNQRARLNTETQISEYAKAHVLPWVSRHEKRNVGADREVRILVCSDLHSTYLDPFAWEVFVETCRQVQPHHICLNGDVADFYAVGRWSKKPGKNLTIQEEIDFVRRTIFAELREACPDANIDWTIGNHEHRLIRFLADTSPALASLDCLEFDKLFNLDRYEVSLVCGGEFLATNAQETKKDINDNWKVYHDLWVATHHTPGGQNPGAKQLKRFGMSGSSGHSHTPSMTHAPTLVAPGADWMVTGMMAGYAVGKEYVDQPSKWNQGFGLVTLIPGKGIVLQQPAIIKEGFAEVAGMLFEETPEARTERLNRFA